MECKTHPDAPHGFLRNASHTEGRYVCECEYWKEHMNKDEAQPEQEPVAHWSDCAVHSEPAYPKGECDCGGFATPPQRKWEGLTKEEIVQIDMRYHHDTWQLIKEAEDKLKEKNT